MRNTLILLLGLAVFANPSHAFWVVVDTGQETCYDALKPIKAPAQDQKFSGQDAQFRGPQPAYRDNGDGTVSDLTTGLMWSKAVEPRKLTLEEAEDIARKMTLGGHTDWRVPTIKELYSLIDFRGATGVMDPSSATAPPSAIPFINTDYFDFLYGGADDRYIDAQWLSCTKYTSTTMGGAETLFGVNFADGRIKGYPIGIPDPRRPEKKFYARYVRGGPYGANDFKEEGDGTITDQATGLMWSKADSGKGMDWEAALKYADQLSLAGHSDWRLPNAKELHSLVDYSRSPDATGSPAIDPVFYTTEIKNEAEQVDWPFVWTSTTHVDGPNASQAVYVAFGRAIGSMHGRTMDVHGAGAQRSDPKTGVARLGHGPQGDAQRVNNFVRCVRGGVESTSAGGEKAAASGYPSTIRVGNVVSSPEPMTYRKSPLAGGNNRPDSGRPADSQGPKTFIERLDKNHDGKISRQEFDGPPEAFDMEDVDGDGFLSPSEAPGGGGDGRGTRPSGPSR